MNDWVFGCRLHLRQDVCGKYEADPRSRGFGRYGGCASCVHRVSANEATRQAELEHRLSRLAERA